MPYNRYNNLVRAKLAHSAKRYNDVFAAMKQTAIIDMEFTDDERNLFHIACISVFNDNKFSWKTISRIEETLINTKICAEEVIGEYRQKLENELRDFCTDVLNILDEYLLKKLSDFGTELNDSQKLSKIIYNKIGADIRRFMAEISTNSAERKQFADSSLLSYCAASDDALAILSPFHPIRLSIAFNYSLLYREILNQNDVACAVIKDALDNALLKMKAHIIVTDCELNLSLILIEMLKTNFNAWNNCNSEEQYELSGDQSQTLLKLNLDEQTLPMFKC